MNPTMNTQEEKPTSSVQFRLDDDDAAIVKDITKVDTISTACKAIVRKAIEDYLKAKD